MVMRTAPHIVSDVNKCALQQHALSLSQGERMLKIQVWKSKSSWLARSSQEKQALINRLTRLVGANLHDTEREEGGPYLIHRAGNALLIWTIKTDSAHILAEYENIRLTDDFEPLTFVLATDMMTAKKLAERLSR